MTSRPATAGDLPAIIALAHTYPYPDLTGPMIESVHVVIDDEGNIIMACAAERIAQLYLYVGEATPLVKSKALGMLHVGMSRDLRDRGYTEVNAFLPEQIAAKFARRLERTFGWVKNWPSWTRRI